MRADLLRVDASRWTRFLDHARHDFYHLPAYVALCATQERGEARALYVEDSGRCMLLPLIIRPIPGESASDATSPYGYPGPLVSGTTDPAFLREAVGAGVPVLKVAGVVSLFVRLHPLLNPSPPDGIGTVVEHGETVIIDLALSDEALWAQTRLNHRRDIRRALGLGFVAYMDQAWEHYETFKRLYRATMRRRSAATYYFFDDAYFDGLRGALGERLHLCVVENRDAIAAAGLFAEMDGIVQYHLSGTDEALARVRPTKLMMHFVRGWAKERGDLYLHLGGGRGGAADSLLRFKAGFSPLRVPFRTLRVVVDETRFRRLVVARDPFLAADAQGAFFPPYRQE
jgi:hypothetical protein